MIVWGVFRQLLPSVVGWAQGSPCSLVCCECAHHPKAKPQYAGPKAHDDGLLQTLPHSSPAAPTRLLA